MDHLLQKSVLVLDANWQAANVTTPQQALTDMFKDTNTALLIKGEYDFQPLSWDKWAELQVEDGDEFIATRHGKILMPRVVIATNFKSAAKIRRMPKVKPSEVEKAYGGVCAYTGRYVGRKGNVDHVIPRHKGGQNTWDNVVWSDVEVNSKKGHKSLEEAGLTAPKIKKIQPMPIVCRIEPRKDRPEWKYFLHR